MNGLMRVNQGCVKYVIADENCLVKANSCHLTESSKGSAYVLNIFDARCYQQRLHNRYYLALTLIG